MRAGDTFFLKKEASDKHLWVVISDPESHPEVVLFATMTSYDITKEDVCLIVPGEHPFIKRRFPRRENRLTLSVDDRSAPPEHGITRSPSTTETRRVSRENPMLLAK